MRILFFTAVIFSSITSSLFYYANARPDSEGEYNERLQALLLQGVKYEEATLILDERGLSPKEQEEQPQLPRTVQHTAGPFAIDE